VLDVDGSTGLESVYTTHENFEIMFHISTLLPYTPNDEQQLERKRHLGNDVVVVIFNDSETQFNPLLVRSQFNRMCFAVISQWL
jgi:hypothetical protein